MSRLTDEYLDIIARDTTDRHVRILAKELQERRAQDLTAEDVETLRVLRDDTSEFGILAPKYGWRSRDEEQDADAAWTRRAIALLDKLLTRGNR